MKIMILKLLRGTTKLEESIFKNSITIIYIVLLFIVFQNFLTSKYNWFSYDNTDAYTYIHKLIVVIYRHSLTWPQRKYAFCLTNKKCMELFYFTIINKLSRTNHRKIMILIRVEQAQLMNQSNNLAEDLNFVKE